MSMQPPDNGRKLANPRDRTAIVSVDSGSAFATLMEGTRILYIGEPVELTGPITKFEQLGLVPTLQEMFRRRWGLYGFDIYLTDDDAKALGVVDKHVITGLVRSHYARICREN